MRTPVSTPWTSAAISLSGRTIALSRSRRLTIPISLPKESPTGSRLIQCPFIRLAVAPTGACGRVVVAGEVISSRARRASAFARSQLLPTTGPVPGRRKLRSPSQSTPAADTMPATSLLRRVMWVAPGVTLIT